MFYRSSADANIPRRPIEHHDEENTAQQLRTWLRLARRCGVRSGKRLGLSDADMQKPKIAVVNSSSELAICFSHLDGIATVVKEAIRAAGGLPFEIRTAAPSDFIIGRGLQRRLHSRVAGPDRE